ncbi:hypothetical protein P9112_003822 [Eukaryota sp. TZLM1-RC]
MSQSTIDFTLDLISSGEESNVHDLKRSLAKSAREDRFWKVFAALHNSPQQWTSLANKSTASSYLIIGVDEEETANPEYPCSAFKSDLRSVFHFLKGSEDLPPHIHLDNSVSDDKTFSPLLASIFKCIPSVVFHPLFSVDIGDESGRIKNKQRRMVFLLEICCGLDLLYYKNDIWVRNGTTCSKFDDLAVAQQLSVVQKFPSRDCFSFLPRVAVVFNSATCFSNDCYSLPRTT